MTDRNKSNLPFFADERGKLHGEPQGGCQHCGGYWTHRADCPVHYPQLGESLARARDRMLVSGDPDCGEE